MRLLYYTFLLAFQRYRSLCFLSVLNDFPLLQLFARCSRRDSFVSDHQILGPDLLTQKLPYHGLQTLVTR